MLLVWGFSGWMGEIHSELRSAAIRKGLESAFKERGFFTTCLQASTCLTLSAFRVLLGTSQNLS